MSIAAEETVAVPSRHPPSSAQAQVQIGVTELAGNMSIGIEGRRARGVRPAKHPR